MSRQVLFCVESNSKARTDYQYIESTIKRFYIDDRKIRYRAIYLGSKTKYNAKDKIREINDNIKKFPGETNVIYFIDVDDYDISQETKKLYDEIKKYCDKNGYDFVFFDKDVEDVYLRNPVSDKEKVSKVADFKRKQLINNVDGVRIIYEIPFDGEDELFWLQPNSRVLTSFEVEDFNAPNRDKCGSIIMEFEYSKSELENQKDNMSAFVKNGFESRFRNIRTMIGYVNAEVNAFNNNLRKFAMQCLEERKKRASSLSFIS